MNVSDSKIYFGWILCLVGVVIALDQASKIAILMTFEQFELLPVIDGVFNLTLTYNKGIAFGLLSGVPDEIRVWILVVTTTLALGLVVFFLLKEYRAHFGSQLALAVIIGGAFGNIIDRLRLGMVVDFLDFYLGSYHWPAFNIADSAICVGVMYLIFLAPGPRNPDPSPEQVESAKAADLGEG